jgi:MYND finger
MASNRKETSDTKQMVAQPMNKSDMPDVYCIPGRVLSSNSFSSDRAAMTTFKEMYRALQCLLQGFRSNFSGYYPAQKGNVIVLLMTVSEAMQCQHSFQVCTIHFSMDRFKAVSDCEESDGIQVLPKYCEFFTQEFPSPHLKLLIMLTNQHHFPVGTLCDYILKMMPKTFSDWSAPEKDDEFTMFGVLLTPDPNSISSSSAASSSASSSTDGSAIGIGRSKESKLRTALYVKDIEVSQTSLINNNTKKMPFPCNTCFKPQSNQKCSKCKKTRYCSKECQTVDWPTHKTICQLVSASSG